MNKEKIIQLLGLATRARKTMLGTDAVLMNVGKGKIKMIFVSSNASNNTKEKLRNKCTYYKIAYVEELSSEELSKATGKNNLMVLGVCDKGFTNNIYKSLKEDVKNESN